MLYYSENDLKSIRTLRLNQLGVTKRAGDTAMTKTSRNLVIGLGGMGLLTVASLKQELRERVGVIDPTIIRFLCLDTSKDDRNTQLKTGLFTENEIPPLDNSDIKRILEMDVAHRPAYVNDIIPAGFCPDLKSQGAGQVRLAGRLSLMSNTIFNDIYQSINSAILELKDFTSKTLDIHIIAGTGGGTGSGLIIDIPYVARKIAMDLNVPSERIRIIGHVYLPNVYKRGGTANLELAFRNGYAALKEIDYYMNIEQINETFDAVYPSPLGACSFTDNIFKQCTLVGGEIAAAMIAENPKAVAVEACVADLINQVTRVEGDIGDSEEKASISDFFSSGAFIDNVAGALTVTLNDQNLNFPQHGNYKYQVVGSSSIKFPTDLIVEGFVGGVMEKADRKLKENANRIKKDDVDTFEREVIAPDYILLFESRMIESKIDNYLYSPDLVWTKDNIKTAAYDTMLNNIISGSLAAFDSKNDIIDNAVSVVNSKAKAIFTDFQKGPYFLSQLLNARSAGGDGVVGFFQRLDGYAEALRRTTAKINANILEIRKNREILRETMQGFGKFGKNLPSYKEMLKALYLNEFRLQLCSRLQSNYYIEGTTGVSYKIKTSLNENFMSFIDVYDEVADICIENKAIAMRKLTDSTSNDSSSVFSLNSNVFKPLKDTVTSTVEDELRNITDEKLNKFISTLTSKMLEEPTKWQAGRENCKTAESFREFLANYSDFNRIMNGTMLDYLEKAYGSEPPIKKENVVREFVDQIIQNSKPMCNIWSDSIWVDLNRLCYQYLVLPSNWSDPNNNTNSDWGTLFEQAFGSNRITKNIYRSADLNAIYSYTMYANMPIWIHEGIKDYENEYYKHNIDGIHINESAQKVPAMKEYPSLFIPSQWFRAKQGNINFETQKESEIRNKIVEDFTFAEKFGIVTKNSNNYYVVNYVKNKPSKEEIEKVIMSYLADPEFDQDIEKFFAYYANKYTATSIPIVSALACQPNNIENATELLRKQMVLLGKFREEVEYFRNTIFAILNRIVEMDNRKKHIKNMSKYMLYDLVYANNMGVWNYALGDNIFPIITRADVADSDASWQIKYMEIAVADAFYKLEKATIHAGLLDEKVKAKNTLIFGGNEDVFEALKAQYNKLKTRFSEIISVVANKKAMGDTLSKTDIEIDFVYKLMLASIDEYISVFSAE